jgi:hypothetical protein
MDQNVIVEQRFYLEKEPTKKPLGFLGRVLRGVLIVVISVVGLTYLLAIGRETNDSNVREFVVSNLATDISFFINPNTKEVKEKTDSELFDILTGNSNIKLEDYDSVLVKFLVERERLTEAEAKKIFKSYRIKLMEHASNTIKDFNSHELNLCSGFFGCDAVNRLESRQLLESSISEKIREKEMRLVTAFKSLMENQYGRDIKDI